MRFNRFVYIATAVSIRAKERQIEKEACNSQVLGVLLAVPDYRWNVVFIKEIHRSGDSKALYRIFLTVANPEQ